MPQCSECRGNGSYPDHQTGCDGNPDECYNRGCPIEVQCEKCRGTGETDVFIKHPAKFSDSILREITRLINKYVMNPSDAIVLDPFAGTGKIHKLLDDDPFGPMPYTVGIEIEPEWAKIHQRTMVGDALHMPFRAKSVDIIATSPTYANRMADHHNAKDDSKRMTYRHTLGRPLHPHNSGQFQWGPKYCDFHENAYEESKRVLKKMGFMIVNASNHIRKGEEIKVVEWHRTCLQSLGFELIKDVTVDTPRMGFGANADARVKGERILVMRLLS